MCLLQTIVGYVCFVIYSKRVNNESTIVLVHSHLAERAGNVSGPEKHNRVNESSKLQRRNNTLDIRLLVNHVNSLCKNITCPVELARDNTWQFVDNDRYVLVFSAYFTDGTIVIISARDRHQPFRQYTCQLWFRNETSQNIFMVESVATANDQTEHHGLR